MSGFGWRSSTDHNIYALDLETGEKRWTFFTEGPVRFAPAIKRKHVYAVSDDGHLYCLDADKLLNELKIETASMYDGMAAANRKIFISLKNGKVVCWQ